MQKVKHISIRVEIRTITITITILVGGNLEEMINVGVVETWSEADGRRNSKRTDYGHTVCRHSEAAGETAVVAATAHHLIGEMEITPITITILVGGRLEETIEGVVDGAVAVVVISPSPMMTRTRRVVTRLRSSKIMAKATIPPRAKRVRTTTITTMPPRAKRATTTIILPRAKRRTTKTTTTVAIARRGRIRDGKMPKAARRVHQRGILILHQRLGSARGKFVSIW
jgi:hypothetical protein